MHSEGNNSEKEQIKLLWEMVANQNEKILRLEHSLYNNKDPSLNYKDSDQSKLGKLRSLTNQSSSEEQNTISDTRDLGKPLSDF